MRSIAFPLGRQTGRLAAQGTEYEIRVLRAGSAWCAVLETDAQLVAIAARSDLGEVALTDVRSNFADFGDL